MAPSKTSTVRSKVRPSGSKDSKTSSSSSRGSQKSAPGPAPKQQKTKRPAPAQTTQNKKDKKRKRTYTAEELGVPTLNGIVPSSGVTKPKSGKKKGKVFVDDPERMMLIYKIVNAEAEGKVESKIMRQRQLEEVREARQKEAERRETEKKGALVCHHLP